MKAIGTRKARVRCQVCKRFSPKFTLYLVKDDTDKKWGLIDACPAGWEITDKGDIVRDMIHGVIVRGFCSEHER
jgi:hypothetical protein